MFRYGSTFDDEQEEKLSNVKNDSKAQPMMLEEDADADVLDFVKTTPKRTNNAGKRQTKTDEAPMSGVTQTQSTTKKRVQTQKSNKIEQDNKTEKKSVGRPPSSDGIKATKANKTKESKTTKSDAKTSTENIVDDDVDQIDEYGSKQDSASALSMLFIAHKIQHTPISMWTNDGKEMPYPLTTPYRCVSCKGKIGKMGCIPLFPPTSFNEKRKRYVHHDDQHCSISCLLVSLTNKKSNMGILVMILGKWLRDTFDYPIRNFHFLDPNLIEGFCDTPMYTMEVFRLTNGQIFHKRENGAHVFTIKMLNLEDMVKVKTIMAPITFVKRCIESVNIDQLKKEKREQSKVTPKDQENFIEKMTKVCKERFGSGIHIGNTSTKNVMATPSPAKNRAPM